MPTNLELEALVKKINERVGQMEDRIDKLLEDNKRLSDENCALKTSVSQEKSKPAAIDTNSTNIWQTVGVNLKPKTSMQIDIINTMGNEMQDRENRKMNIVVFGIESSNHVDQAKNEEEDKAKIQNLLSTIDIDINAAKKIIRVKSRNASKPAPIIITLHPEFSYGETPLDVIKKAYAHRDKIKNVYINRDLTIIERQQGKQLREKCKAENERLTLSSPQANYTHVIRGNMIVKKQRST